MKLPRPDPYLIAILISVGLAIALPIRGEAADVFTWVVKGAVALLFFLYGARLPREQVFAGLTRWRLHVLVLSVTFVLYPAIGVLFGFAPPWLIAPPLAAGLIYMCCLPSTIQSSVALVGSARGDVAAAVCSASASNMIGVVLSPLLIAVLMRTQGVHVSLEAVRDIILQLLVPFALGQLVHPWLAAWAARNSKWLTGYDRLTIMMIVYSAFSATVIGGVFRQVQPAQLLLMGVIALVLVSVVMTLSVRVARLCGFSTEDEIVVAFCGTQKGMAAGVPMASLIFPPEAVGLLLVPLLIYHPLQLIICAAVAGRYARRGAPPAA